MGYRAMTALGVAALMLAGAPMYARAESTSETPSATEKMEQKAEQLGGKAKRTAKEAKGDVTDAWVTAKAKIALFGDDRVKGRQISVETQEGTVILRGKVDSEEAKTTAAETVKGVEHVKGVRNELQVVGRTNRSEVAANDKTLPRASRLGSTAMPGSRPSTSTSTMAWCR